VPCGIPWCEDASNTRDAFFSEPGASRGVPAGVPPPNVTHSVARRAREMLEEDDVALETWLAALRPFAKDALYYSTGFRQTTPLLRRALHRWLLAHPASGDCRGRVSMRCSPRPNAARLPGKAWAAMDLR